MFIICVEVITYLLLYNLHDCTFKASNAYLFRIVTLKIMKVPKESRFNI